LKPKNQPKEPKFEESLERLEAIVHEMESGDLPLEEILKKYEDGNRLIQFCASKLNEAEKRIEVLMKEKDGSLGVKTFDLDKENEEEEAESEENNGKAASPATDEDKDLF
jgi:exodeoxyribonuclease VII small subunit